MMSRKWYVIAGFWAAIWFSMKFNMALEAEKGLSAGMYFALALLGIYFLADEIMGGKR
jgi:hypothetical protein